MAEPETGDQVSVWWEQVTACALLGTARRPVPSLPEILGEAISSTRAGDPCGGDPDRGDPDRGEQDRLLDQIALGSGWRATPPRLIGADPLPPAPEERDPIAPPRALQILDLLLNQSPLEDDPTGRLLWEWVETAADAGVRVPATFIPAIFDLVEKQADATARERLLSVTGARGRWLADLDPLLRTSFGTGETAADHVVGPAADPGAGAPSWGAHAADPMWLPTDWLQRPLEEQVGLLSQQRSVAPDLARDSIVEAYRTGSARERAAYIGVLGVRLSEADEELLDRALGDRSGGVRDAAARLLERLPGSLRSARMAERLRPLVSVSRRGLGRRRINILLPGTPDSTGVRDGLGKAHPGRSTRGHHLTEIVAGAPLSLWRELTGLEPDEILRALDDGGDVATGLHRATVAQRDRVWVRALLEGGSVHPDLLEILDPAESERFVIDTLLRSEGQAVAPLLRRIPGPWGADLSAAVLARMRRSHGEESARLIAELGSRMHPSLMPQLQAAVERLPIGPARDRAARVVTFVTLRQTISEAFR